ncbi:Replication-associated recombination protein A [subsurface metagenome]|nr:AAA family ATPase [Bacillota bacterium]
MELFAKEKSEAIRDMPLALRMSPKRLSQFVGQEHILGKGKLLRRAIEADRIVSLIFYGPSGCGKSALARIIAEWTKAHFEELNAVTSGVADLRKIIEGAWQKRKFSGQKTTLLIDELHHFNRSQQDGLLPDVEKGIVTLIGITTENPYFYINSRLLSRSQIFEFKPLNDKELKVILKRAIEDKENGLGKKRISIAPEALKHLIKTSNGDARRALNALEVGVMTTKPSRNGEINFTLSVAEESIQKKAVVYDKKGNEHYDTISAFIKSMRGSDPDATLYWLAKMIYVGEDPRFIARRIVICASEDVGNADPQALVVANAALEACEFLGMPEAKIPLAQAAIYIACALKSNAAYKGIDKALADIEEKKILKPPKYLTKAGQKDYKYPHNYAKGWVEQDYLPVKRKYYFPTEEGYEAKIKKRMEELESRIAKDSKFSHRQKPDHPIEKVTGKGKGDKDRTF